MTEGGRAVVEVAGALVGLALGMCALIAIAARLVLLPWIRTHVLEPVHETNRQVTVNGHKSADPTLKDSVHTLQEQYAELRRDIATAAWMFEGHIHASEVDRGNLWRAIRGEPPVDPPDSPAHRRTDL